MIKYEGICSPEPMVSWFDKHCCKGCEKYTFCESEWEKKKLPQDSLTCPYCNNKAMFRVSKEHLRVWCPECDHVFNITEVVREDYFKNYRRYLVIVSDIDGSFVRTATNDIEEAFGSVREWLGVKELEPGQMSFISIYGGKIYIEDLGGNE